MTKQVTSTPIKQPLVQGEKEIPVRDFGSEQLKLNLGEDYSYEIELHQHVAKVRGNIDHFIGNMANRAFLHDASKFTSAEFDIFEKVSPELRTTTYGTDEYKALLKKLGPALDHHYANNDHHPEHFPNGVNDMDLFQFVEMLCDWKAAVEKHDDGDIYKSLEINKNRFGISDQLYQIMVNTIKRW